MTDTENLDRFLDSSGDGGVFVPTMGALHAGHAQLIERAAATARERSIAAGASVSIFVNPTQFNEQSDYARYPRTLDADLDICRRAGAAMVFVPPADVIYPPGQTIPTPPLPAVATAPGLEDAFRPGHFAGVCQVVHRLFSLVRPAAAIFGEKDWQQLQTIAAMTAAATGRGELPAIEIIPAPTRREPDGLAMSSRNVFLSPEHRAAAPVIARALRESGPAAHGDPVVAERIMREQITAAGLAVEYAVVRDAQTLLAPRDGRPMRALVAARAGATRLIDNAVWPEAGIA